MKKLTLLICLFISFNLFAQPFSLVKEINTTANTSSIGSSLIQRVGATVYFVSNDGTSGNELWKSDGTNAGTGMVMDITPGAAGTVFSLISEGNGLLFFVANDGVNGSELWRSDGTTAGTYMLKDIKAGNASSDINRLFFHNGFMFFGADDGTNGSELWKSDGTVAGTFMVKDIYTGSNASSPTPFSNPLYTMVALGNDVYFAALGATGGRELYKTDGTAGGTSIVKDIYPGDFGAISVTAHKAAVYNGKLYFAANDGVNGIELWATDGTDAGTYRVKDIVAGSGSSQPNNLIAFNGALYFTASSTNSANPDLYKTDGTEAGTVMVRNLVSDGIILTIGNSSANDQFTIANGKLFFRGGGPNGNELYTTDGTTAGTGIVKDIYPGLNSVNANGLFAYNNDVYLIGTDVELPSRSVLYKSDGTAAGTVQLTDGAFGGALGMGAITMTSAGGKLFFWGNTNDNGSELWSTDGTNANTTLVKDINTIKIGTPNSGTSFFGTLTYNGYYYYAAVDDTHGNELWKSDGTNAGTVLVKDIWPGKAPSNPAQFFVYNGAIYFTASNGLSGTELWKTDGTEVGTVLVADINSGPVNSGPNRFFISNNFLYFTAYHSLYGIELWRSDGTAAGTTMVIDLVTGAGHGTFGISDVISIGNNAYAIMNLVAGNVLGIPSGNRLIKIDGIANTISDFATVITAGTDLGIVGNTLYITGRNAASQTLLWKSENGGAVTQVKILSTTVTNAYQLTNCGGKLYFSASNGTAAGQEPWISDGTDAGTFMLKDINPGANPSTPYQFVFSGGKVFFTASSISNNNSEYELWATDGTTGGTYLIKDILSSSGSRPNATISAFGNKVLFTANNGASGYELWQSDGTAAGTFLLQEFNTNGDGIPLTGFAFNFPTDFVYSKLGDKIVFFARSADKGLQLYSGSIASPYKYVNDNSTANDVFTTAVGNNANNGSQSAPYATLSHAVSQAQAGDSIYVDAGVFVEQVTIDKGITLIGAGSGATIVLKPAVINPPPGFNEPGTIQSAQNIGDVHIRDMSVTGDDNGVTPIILQTGGSVKNCRLINGNQGIFLRVNPAIKNAVIENNYIRVSAIGINCQGSGLTATLINNTIELTNPGFAAGVFAGLDFGPLVRFTAFGNIINNYNYVGFLANSYNTNITQNSILGTGQYAIQQGTNSLGFATCNWYGTTNAATIASKVSGFFSYTPYLTNGTNTNTTSGNYGFVPVAGSCNDGVNNFYVNDNSRTNDVFTTAVGSNSNPGTSVAPFATLSYAISVAPVNSVIHVDAGTYAEQVIIDRGIVINGAGKELTNFVKPVVALIPAPGPFTELGLIATTQGIGDVHIRNISVNSVDGTSQNIIIQSGGIVKNCKLLNGGQGVFFRYASGSRNAEVSFNTIQPTGIGINCQGAGLSANIVNNTISNPAGYYSGIFAGLDFGALPQLTVTNNKISDYFGIGILANAAILPATGLTNSNITNNSIVGTPSSIAIQGNALNATCNWYGSTTPSIAGPVIYSPFLNNGTDNDIYNLGFQPVPNSCTGIQNKFYVNDNSNVGNIFTTAVGDDINNNGGPSAPLATIANALSKAQSGDTIFVDAGSYTEIVNVTKDITIRGAGIGVTILNGPAGPVTPFSGTSETGIIQSTAGVTNVIIENMTIDGAVSNESHGTFIQGGGRISYCELRYVNDGFYFQYLSTEARTAVGNNNYVHHINYVGALFAGNGLSATATNNVIDLTGALYGIGFISGYGGNGNVASFTASNNSIIKFNGFGIMAGSLQTAQIHNNSITRITGNYFENRHTVNVDATCNWFGTNNASVIIPNVLGDVAYSPWLSNGTDNDVAFGFQPVPASCNGLRLSATLDGSTNITCNGANNGSINITVTSGVAPYTFAWTRDSDPTIISTNEDPTNLAPGIYHLQVTDAIGTNVFVNNAGTVYTIDVTITEPDVLTASPNRTNVSCFNGTNGTASVLVNGGNAPYAYLWSNGATTNEINNLAAGNYTVTVTDANGCIAQASYQVTQPPLLTAVATGTSTSCANTATVTVNGGTVPYSYSWSNGAITQSIASIPAGTYTVTVTDDKGCTASSSVTVTANQAFNPSASVTNVLCFGTATGSITITNVNGVSPFQFSLNGVDFSSSAPLPYTFSGLAAGSYTITVKDANGCTGFVTKTVTEPPLLVVTQGSVQSTCSGQSTGSIAVIVTGGSGTLSYSWTGPGGYTSTQRNISDLSTGNYSLTVADANGCLKILNVTVPVYPAINLTASITNVLCFGGSTGSIDVTVSGGTGSGFTYLWNNLATTQDRFNLAAGNNYRITVTDIGSVCSVSRRDTVLQPSSVVAVSVNNQSIINVSGCTSLGSFTAQGSGGIQYPNPDPYRYSINGVDYQTSRTFSNLAAGNYTVTVKDANGCTATRPVVIDDNGSDEYESLPNNPGNNTNNTRGKAAPINLGGIIRARIGTAGDVDYYKLSPANTWSGSYTLSFVQPATAVNIYLVASNGNTIIPAADSSASHKQYNVTNGTYFVRVNGSNSTNCYQFTVSTVGAARTSETMYTENKKETIQVPSVLKALVYPNPHQGAFDLNISSPEETKATIQIITADGKIVISRDVRLQKGNSNIFYFEGIHQSVLLYRVTVNNKTVTGKIIGPN